MQHPHWETVNQIIHKLQQAGFMAWLAGGCVRDFLLNKSPKDFDIVTNAKPLEIEKLFPSALEIGKKFGIVILPFKGFQVEIATFRKDGPYKDGRHPENVSFASPQEDAMRRDFTINALFYDPVKAQVIDYVGGQSDLEKKIIRCVGDPEKRFQEDQLRVLRAFRFCAQLGFEIEEETFYKASQFSLTSVSKERVREEIKKLGSAKYRLRGLSRLEQSGILRKLIPEISNSQYLRLEDMQLPPWNLSKLFLINSTDITHSQILWVFLFVPLVKTLGAHLTKELGQRFRLSREEIRGIEYVVENLIPPAKLKNLKRSTLLKAFGHKYGDLLFLFYENLNQILPNLVWPQIRQTVKTVVPPLGQMPKPLVTAHDLMKEGFKGEDLGKALKLAYELQLDSECANRTSLLEKIKLKRQ